MKRIVLFLSCLSVFSLSAFELDIDMGGGAQYTGAEGNLVYAKDTWKGSSAKIDHESSVNFYTWVNLETDQAYWPKMRLEYSHIKTEGTSNMSVNSGNILIDTAIDLLNDKLIEIGIDLKDLTRNSRLDQSTYEAFLYYEYFEDTSFPTFGVGLGAKMFDFAYSATIIDGVDGLEFTDNGGETVPLLFFKSRYELDKEDDSAQLSFEATGKVYLFGDSTIYDYMVKTDFMMQYNETTDIGFELGYKASFYDIKGSDINTVGGDMSNSGIYVGLVGHFR